jgi:murein tripeptide amidase MpaA
MVFKIVPMVNVDGVVLGNFRTGIAGRDLNRVFTSPQQYKEI